MAEDFVQLKARWPRRIPTSCLRLPAEQAGTAYELGYVRTLREMDEYWVRFELSRGVPKGLKDVPLNPCSEWIYVPPR